MLHQMKLQPAPFEAVTSHRKTIELRLNDEKRQKVQTGDYIEFTCTENPQQKCTVRVIARHSYPSFHELIQALPASKYSINGLPFASDTMDAFYSKEAQATYDALGLEFRLTDLQKFLDAQEYGYGGGETYQTALREIRQGFKRSHWIWYVFPQIQGLGRYGTSAIFSISNMQEAIDYIQHPVLGARLIEISKELLALGYDDPLRIFDSVDALKLRSSMTLFHLAAPDEPIFAQVLAQYCRGVQDEKTLDILHMLASEE